ncbi:MAG: HlyC/CorC family transporter, partial [Clostridia bacterium]|nr:HlyC/CorC family transporter [Clostridia bacterium]
VGDIFDERDEVEDDVQKIDDNTYLVDGSVNVADVFELFDWEPQDFETEYTTVGGWATEMLDKFPVAGDSFEYQRLKVTVLKAASMRVESVKVEYTPPEDEAEEEPEEEEEKEE